MPNCKTFVRCTDDITTCIDYTLLNKSYNPNKLDYFSSGPLGVTGSAAPPPAPPLSSDNNAAEFSEFALVANIPLLDRLGTSKSLVFDTIRLFFDSVSEPIPAPPSVPYKNFQVGIYKLVNKGTLVVGDQNTYDNNSELITKTTTKQFKNEDDRTIVDLSFDSEVELKADADYFIEFFVDNNPAISNPTSYILRFLSSQSELGLAGYCYVGETNPTLSSIPNVLAGANGGAGGFISAASTNAVRIPYYLLYKKYF